MKKTDRQLYLRSNDAYRLRRRIHNRDHSTGSQAAGSETTASAEETKAAEGDFVADVNGDGKIIVGYISKNLTDPFHGLSIPVQKKSLML